MRLDADLTLLSVKTRAGAATIGSSQRPGANIKSNRWESLVLFSGSIPREGKERCIFPLAPLNSPFSP